MERQPPATMFKRETTYWTVEGELLVSFFAAGPIARDVWQDYCDTIAAPEVRCVLAASRGIVEVDAEQRRQVHVAVRSDPCVVVAVVTDEPLVRGLLVATAWLGRIDAKAFTWAELDDAFRYLGPAGIDEAEALERLDRVRRRVEGG